MKPRCPKTKDGIHLWKYLVYKEYPDPKYMLAPVYANKCRACGFFDDANAIREVKENQMYIDQFELLRVRATRDTENGCNYCLTQ